LVQVKFTDTQRATLTAFAFIDGIFGSTVDVNLPQPLPADPLLKVRILIITKQGFVHFYIILYYIILYYIILYYIIACYVML